MFLHHSFSLSCRKNIIFVFSRVVYFLKRAYWLLLSELTLFLLLQIFLPLCVYAAQEKKANSSMCFDISSASVFLPFFVLFFICYSWSIFLLLKKKEFKKMCAFTQNKFYIFCCPLLQILVLLCASVSNRKQKREVLSSFSRLSNNETIDREE